jgi:GT2 family glycosyltransferase
VQPKITVVTCSRREPEWQVHYDNIRRTCGVDVEYLRVDNRTNKYSLSGAYGLGVQQARGEIIVFVHEDVFFVEPGWGLRLLARFEANPKCVGLGPAGASVLRPEMPSWVSVGRPWIHGKVLHVFPDGVKNLCVYGDSEHPARVVALDGLCMAFRKSLFDHVYWDSRHFDGFHFYDMDICAQAVEYGELWVTEDLVVAHHSGGKFDQIWWQYAERFTIKHLDRLPLLAPGVDWDGQVGPRFDSVDLSARWSRMPWEA